MAEIPWDALRAHFLKRLEETGSEPVFATLSGAHLYGFPSRDSDFDVRGAHLAPFPKLLSLFPSKETIESMSEEDGPAIDMVSHDLAKFARMLLKKNGYVMEQVFSPLAVLGGPLLEELRAIARRCVTRHLYHHYAGFADNQRRLLDRERRKKLKTLLYLYRVLLTGIHVLRTGEVEANLGRLLEGDPGLVGVRDLINAKVREQSDVPPGEWERHEEPVTGLRGRLDEAFAGSKLPEEAEGALDLDAFLLRLRTKGLSRG